MVHTVEDHNLTKEKEKEKLRFILIHHKRIILTNIITSKITDIKSNLQLTILTGKIQYGNIKNKLDLILCRILNLSHLFCCHASPIKIRSLLHQWPKGQVDKILCYLCTNLLMLMWWLSSPGWGATGGCSVSEEAHSHLCDYKLWKPLSTSLSVPNQSLHFQRQAFYFSTILHANRDTLMTRFYQK